MSKKKPYLKQNRLADVLALIQILAFDEQSHRSVEQLNSELQGKPQSATSWKNIAKEHSEFFRFSLEQDKLHEDKGHTISLIARHAKLTNPTRIADTLSPDLAKKFFETAIQLHDIQKERAGRWKVWIPLLIALFTVGLTVGGSLYVQHENNQNQILLKHYEVDLKPKRDGYGNFMKAVSQSFFSAQSNNFQQMIQSLDEAENAYYLLEPFLTDRDRDRIWRQIQQFSGFCYRLIAQINNPKSETKTWFNSFTTYKEFFKNNLYNALFIKDK